MHNFLSPPGSVQNDESLLLHPAKKDLDKDLFDLWGANLPDLRCTHNAAELKLIHCLELKPIRPDAVKEQRLTRDAWCTEGPEQGYAH